MQYLVLFLIQCFVGYVSVGASNLTNTTNYMVLSQYQLSDIKKLPMYVYLSRKIINLKFKFKN